MDKEHLQHCFNSIGRYLEQQEQREWELPGEWPLKEMLRELGDALDLFDNDDWRLKTHRIELSNQQIVELSYVLMELLTPLIQSHTKLFFEQANCYGATFGLLKKLLSEKVDAEYLDLEQHSNLKEFYTTHSSLDNTFDRLRWVMPEED